ncbi:MAG TPA: thiamine phosphate synthase [Pseudolabrys sp.]|jgi:thiamine-phosphate pyrophosphorylase|nr:thiamine phosphate synthase [Pseudolabrys sp.]
MASRPKQAEPRPQPRLYLVTPEIADAADFAAPLAAALAAGDVAAVLLRLAPGDERSLTNCVKELAPLVQKHEAALLLDGHPELVARGGADGAHLTDVAAFEAAVGTLKPERIAGCGGLATRHDAMLAAERDSDYVMFGDPDDHGERAAFAAIEERVTWWAEVFEAPCVAYAGSLEEVAPLVKAGADFIALGDWMWRDPAAILAAVNRDLVLPESVT